MKNYKLAVKIKERIWATHFGFGDSVAETIERFEKDLFIRNRLLMEFIIKPYFRNLEYQYEHWAIDSKLSERIDYAIKEDFRYFHPECHVPKTEDLVVALDSINIIDILRMKLAYKCF
ncbi:MAG: hypothetical protein N4A40_13220 [Tissierellales bacterium]|jgi:hypothetical protein|nr:hypothetical protein [Tissierellales bacterium]